jgi:hypothetical protein
MKLIGNSLECRNLTKRFVKDAVALDGVSFSVETNGIFWFQMPSFLGVAVPVTRALLTWNLDDFLLDNHCLLVLQLLN